MLFSQRQGLKPIKKTIQIDFISKDLRNSLWNCLSLVYLRLLKKKYTVVTYGKRSLTREGETFILSLWVNYFKNPIDSISNDYDKAYKEIRSYFFTTRWGDVYDFIEFFAKMYHDKEVNNRFMKMCNSVLKSELSGYRFVEGEITPITSEEEISAIEEASNIPGDRFKGSRIQIKSALDKLSNRKSPDYRGSIKDSISAVEGAIRTITRESSFKKGLKKIEEKSKVHLHPALKKAFIKLYAYTSNAEGIRHSLLDEPQLNFTEAKFMLVSCSAFVNYLIDKTK